MGICTVARCRRRIPGHQGGEGQREQHGLRHRGKGRLGGALGAGSVLVGLVGLERRLWVKEAAGVMEKVGWGRL